MYALTPGDDDPPLGSTGYHAAARALGDRLLLIASPVRVLDAVRWDESVGVAFLARGGRDLPPVTAESYRPLPFDPAAKRRELLDLERDTCRRLGRGDPLGRLMCRRCRQFRAAVDLLTSRGTPAFARLARAAYGDPTPAEDEAVAGIFAALEAATPAAPPASDRTLDAATAAGVLAARLGWSLAAAGRCRVRVCDRLLSDAAASGRTVKLRRGARFSAADVGMLEVHEGWAHVGTTLNARRQPVCGFLGHGPPATTAAQEGLAVLCELLAGVAHAGRVRRLARRYEAVRRADAGADFRDVYRFFLAESDDPADAYQQAARVFRGSLPAGAGPFPKDQTYGLGLLRLLRSAHAAIRGGRPDRLRLLFAGKVAFGDLPLLTDLADAGLLAPPAILPPPFDDARALAARLHALPHPPHRLPRPIGPADGHSPADDRAMSLPTARPVQAESRRRRPA